MSTLLLWTQCTYRTYITLLLLLGLPFHHHGDTWLGLVYGMKRWFIYPPGASPPASIERTYNPLYPVLDWFTSTYPLLKGLNQPPVNGDIPVPQEAGHKGYRPLECVQMPGDIMYVPASWAHSTINIGKVSFRSDSYYSYSSAAMLSCGSNNLYPWHLIWWLIYCIRANLLSRKCTKSLFQKSNNCYLAF